MREWLYNYLLKELGSRIYTHRSCSGDFGSSLLGGQMSAPPLLSQTQWGKMIQVMDLRGDHIIPSLQSENTSLSLDTFTAVLHKAQFLQ